MARYTEALCKLCRREGFKMYLKGERCYSEKCACAKRNYAPGQHGKEAKKLTQYGTQLRAKQALKRIYGLLERQFRNYFELATSKTGETGEVLMQLLESRLDSVVYQMGFAVNRTTARQMVRHGHILVNGKKVNIPSFGVKPGSTIEIKESVRTSQQVKDGLELAKKKAAKSGWVDVNADSFKGTFVRKPKIDEVEIPVDIQAIIEFYSK